MPIALTTLRWAFSGDSCPARDRLRPVVDRVEHQVGVDRRAAVADQGRHVMVSRGLARLEDQARRARAARTVMVNRADREQGGIGTRAAGPAVGKDQDVEALSIASSALRRSRWLGLDAPSARRRRPR